MIERRPHILTGTMSLLLLTPILAQSSEDAAANEKTYPVFVAADVLLDSKARENAEIEDEVQDLLVDTNSGRITGVLFESGAIAPFDELRWNPDEGEFVRSRTRGRSGFGTAEAAASSDEKEQASKSGQKAGGNSRATFLLSKLIGLTLLGAEREEDGTLSDEDLGSVGGAFVDVRSGRLAFMTTSVGGVLGIGAESRVIPWTALELERDKEGEHRLRTSLTEDRLDDAPAFGEGPDNLNNPSYRDSLYSYYGTERAHFDLPQGAVATVIPIDRMLGADVARAGDEEDSLKDLIVDPESGKVTYAVLESGDVLPIAALRWQTRARSFVISGEAKSEKIDKKKQLLASKLPDFEVRCGGEECGDLEDLWFDTGKNQIAYVTIEHDGVRVLPWSMVTLQPDAETPHLRLAGSRERLERAPVLDGNAGNTIYGPEFRARVEAFGKEK